MIYIWHWKTIENPHKSSNRPCDGRIAAIKKTIKTAESQRPFNIVRCSEWFFKGSSDFSLPKRQNFLA